MVVSLYTDLAEKDLNFGSFLEQEITGNKNQEFPDRVPFPLLISLILFAVTGRKTDSDLSELTKEGELT